MSRQHRGVTIIHRSTYKSSKISSLHQVKTFECVCNRLNANRDGDFVVASIYRLGSAVVTREFFTELTTFLEALVTYRCPVILLGDFNIHTVIADDVHATELIDLMTSFNMSQHVKEATHNAGGCIDLIFTRSECRVTRVTVSEVGLSDHCFVTCGVPVRRSEITATPIEGRRWKQFSIDVLKADLANMVLCKDLS